MPFAGRPLDRYGPRLLTIAGGVIVGIGWILGSMATSMGMLAITYGLIGGAGVGIVYNCPIGVAGRWFPDRRGLAVGATVLGFGLSPLITAPLARQWIQAFGPLTTFGYLGGIFLVLIVLLALPLRFPPEGWKPQDWEPGRGGVPQHRDLSRSEMVRTRSFWGLWICYVIGTLAGLMAIGISSSVGQEVFLLSAGTAASFTGVFAIFNGGGRPLFGYFVDRIAPQRTAILSFLIIFLAACALALGAAPGAIVVYVVGFSALWLCLGGWLAIAPACTGAFCGTKFYGPNYGLVFTAYGAGAVLGNLLAGRMRDLLGSYTAVFMPVAVLAVAGMIIAYFTLKPPE
jgi:MFS family permease